jgi:hypothetical protein
MLLVAKAKATVFRIVIICSGLGHVWEWALSRPRSDSSRGDPV